MARAQFTLTMPLRDGKITLYPGSTYLRYATECNVQCECLLHGGVVTGGQVAYGETSVLEDNGAKYKLPHTRRTDFIPRINISNLQSEKSVLYGTESIVADAHCSRFSLQYRQSTPRTTCHANANKFRFK
ncbi:hypothetical protein AVEN_83353-1, partial [Araneus ventricosus]